MLVLSRRPGEKLLFPDFDTVVQVVSIQGGAVRLGIEAPREVQVLRAELNEKRGGPRARGRRSSAMAPRLPRARTAAGRRSARSR